MGEVGVCTGLVAAGQAKPGLIEFLRSDGAGAVGCLRNAFRRNAPAQQTRRLR